MPLTGENRVAVKFPESPFMHEPEERNVPENWLGSVLGLPVNVMVAPLSRVTVKVAW